MVDIDLHDTVSGLPRTDVAGIDVGATKTSMYYHSPDTGQVSNLEVKTIESDSMEELLRRCFGEAGCLPRSMVAGVAGRPLPGGNVQITNHKNWPVFDRAAFESELGLSLSIVNDMLATLAGVGELGEGDTEPLGAPIDPPSNPARLVVSVGTGVGSAYMDALGGFHSSETGHLPWQPVDERQWEYLRRLQLHHPGVAVSIEQAIGGLRGFDHLYDFVSLQHEPSSAVRAAVAELRDKQQGIGPAVTAGALAGDAACAQVADLFGTILGQYLRLLTLSNLTEGGSIYLTSSVLQADGFADHLIERTGFRDCFVSSAAEHAPLMAATPLFLITDHEVAVRGAFALARQSHTG